MCQFGPDASLAMEALVISPGSRVIVVFLSKDRTESLRLNDSGDIGDHSAIAA